MTLQEIQNRRTEINAECTRLKKEVAELTIAEYRLQNYTESIELIPNPDDGRRKKIEVLRGRIHWTEDFVDEDAGEVVSIERSRIVMEDNIWDI